ncbi:thiamine transporter 1-like isoform X2 [Linepithema humile]|uniref:thiamine transporter 1-like isoform X2 n=1 Tax=Linepithema humile TaxID=83485 RepID=UPI00351DBE61
MHWIKISCILCMFGCFKDFRPIEPFITDYFIGYKNFTASEVNHDIYPIITYSYLSTLVFVFLITDFVRYKPIIILCGLSGIIAFLLLILEENVLVMQIAELFFGLFLSTKVAYYTYIYAKVDKQHYQELTSHTKAASLFGHSVSGIVAQLTASFELLNYYQLNYLTVLAITVATIWSLFLPPVDRSIYFHHVDNFSNDNENPATLIQEMKEMINQSQPSSDLPELCDNKNSKTKRSILSKIKNAYKLLWKHFLQAYTNYHVIKWSAWWALSTCGYVLVEIYSQLLWQTAVKTGDKIYNGAVDFAYAIIGGAILLASSYIYNIWFLYIGYVVFGIIYHTMVTVASFEVAKRISQDSHGLIFGVNMFLALLMQSLILVIVNMLMLDIRQQYCIYSGYHLVLGVIYIVLAVITIKKHRRNTTQIRWTS